MHNRLRIVDVSERSDQPMTSGHNTIVFNGEIYNFRQLRSQLKDEGYEFRTQGDTEVILHAYSHWGAACVHKLEGMFAFAIWDGVANELFLARDRLGKKPLFFCHTKSQFFFGSEIKAILAALPSTPGIDFTALDDYLTYFYVPYPRTIFSGIRQLEPSKWLRVKVHSDITTDFATYWKPIEEAVRRDRATVLENEFLLSELLEHCVSERLVSDVPLGVLLSGGLDSSSITALMARSSAGPIRSFSVGFKGDQQYDEVAFAKV